MAQYPSEINDIEFTLVHADHVLTKTIDAVDANGKPKSGVAPFLSSGQAERVFLSSDTFPTDFPALLKVLRSNEAVMCGEMIPPGNAHRIVTKKARAAGAQGITRTKDNFRPSLLVCFDVDLGDATPAIRQRFEQEGVVEVLQSVVPAFVGVAIVQRASTSSFIVDALTGGRTGLRGVHLYFLVSNPLDWPRAARAIEARLMLAGFGFPVIRASGRIDVKTPLDITASIDPSRLFFEGNAIFTDPALSYEPNKRVARVWDGLPLDTNAIADLSSDEMDKLARIEAKLREGVAEKAAHVAKTFHANRAYSGDIVELTGGGKAGVPEFVVYGDTAIYLDDGRVVTTIDVLLDPEAFDGLTCADLDEPDYGGGHNLARIYARCRHPYVWSQAHSGRKFFLRVNADDLVRIATEGV